MSKQSCSFALKCGSFLCVSLKYVSLGKKVLKQFIVGSLIFDTIGINWEGRRKQLHSFYLHSTTNLVYRTVSRTYFSANPSHAVSTRNKKKKIRTQVTLFTKSYQLLWLNDSNQNWNMLFTWEYIVT